MQGRRMQDIPWLINMSLCHARTGANEMEEKEMASCPRRFWQVGAVIDSATDGLIRLLPLLFLTPNPYHNLITVKIADHARALLHNGDSCPLLGSPLRPHAIIQNKRNTKIVSKISIFAHSFFLGSVR